MVPVITAGMSIMAVQECAMHKSLSPQIIAEGQWIVADMDGTLVGSPGRKVEPTLQESEAKEAVIEWLRLGGQLLVITGCEKERAIERFLTYIPHDELRDALVNRRLVFAANGGAALCYFDGKNWVEDLQFQDTALGGRKLEIACADQVIAQGTALLNQFYKGVAEGSVVVDERLKKQYVVMDEILKERTATGSFRAFTSEELVSLNTNQVPRIEVRKTERGNIVHIAVIGIPADHPYDVSSMKVDESVDVSRINFTVDIACAGFDKAVPLRYLQQKPHGYLPFDIEKSFAIGDRPKHNDQPLREAMRFVSVCEKNTPNYVPEGFRAHIGDNQAGSARFIRSLIAHAKADEARACYQPVLMAHFEDALREASQKE